jgi:hypothetical protein
MILAHVVDDFVLQPVCLSKLKQKSWWEKQEGYKRLYKDDYKMALLIHSMSWSIMILIPAMFILNPTGALLFGVFIVNTLIHYTVDNEKANKGHLNLMVDQFIHLSQIFASWVILCQWL